MDESTEELKANMKKAFAQRVETDRELSALADHLNSRKGTYAAAGDYAYRAGNALSVVLQDNIKAETLENGVFTKEFVENAVVPLLKDNHRIVSSMAAVAQENINAAAGVHIRVQKAEFNQDRADGFVTKMDGKTMEEAGWMLGSPVSNFSQSVVDETMQKNGEVLAKAGKAATVKREAEAKCCDWCLSKSGSYDAENREAYQRHRECRCVIEMHLDGSVKRQTDWKHNIWEERRQRIAEDANKSKVRSTTMPLNLQFFAKKHRTRKVPRDNPLWDSLVQGDVDKQLKDRIFRWQFGGYDYLVEITEKYEYNYLSKKKVKNIHERNN